MPGRSDQGLNRRAFCAGASAGVVVGASALLWPGCRSAGEATPRDAAPTPLALPAIAPPDELTLTAHGEGRQQVIEVRWARGVDAFGQVDAVAVQAMLDAALARLAGSWSASAKAAQAPPMHDTSSAMEGCCSPAIRQRSIDGAWRSSSHGAQSWGCRAWTGASTPTRRRRSMSTTRRPPGRRGVRA